MGRNTLRRQLERALQTQKEYEQVNFEKLEASRQIRDAEAKRKQEEAVKKAADEEERQTKLAEERKLMQDQAREWADAATQRRQEKENEEASRPKKSKKSRKVKTGSPTADEDEDQDGDISDTKEERTKRKRRTIARPNALSDERVVKSEDEDDVEASIAVSGDDKPRSKKRKVLSQARIIDSDEEDEEMRDEPMTRDTGETANGGGVVHEEGSDDGLFGEDEGNRMADD